VSSDKALSRVSVTSLSGEKVEGTLVGMDDFLLTLKLNDGSIRSFSRNGAVPKVVVGDPLKAHKDMLSVYTDKDVHDVTAFLVTLK
jgi:cytochrome c oxidase cbb3-type subunit 3